MPISVQAEAKKKSGKPVACGIATMAASFKSKWIG
jgi:hypothetical protein